MRYFGNGLVFPEPKTCPNCDGAGCEDCSPPRCRARYDGQWTPVDRTPPAGLDLITPDGETSA